MKEIAASVSELPKKTNFEAQTEALAAFKQALQPYLSLDPEYIKKTKDRAAELFPWADYPDMTLHYGVCFAEGLERTFFSKFHIFDYQKPIEELAGQKNLRDLESSFSNLVMDFEHQVTSNGKIPYLSHDFLARDLSKFAEMSAKENGLPVVGLVYNRSGDEYIYPTEVLQGEALGRAERGNRFIAGFGDPYHGVKRLFGLLASQLEWAQKHGELSELGGIMKQHLMNEAITEFIAERFALGQLWVLTNLRHSGYCAAKYLAYHLYCLPAGYFKSLSEDGNENWVGLTDLGKEAIATCGRPSTVMRQIFSD